MDNSILNRSAKLNCSAVQALSYKKWTSKGEVRTRDLDKIADEMFGSVPRGYHVVSNSPLTSGQYRISSNSVLSDSPTLGTPKALHPPLSFVYYKDLDKYYSNASGLKITQRPKSAGANIGSRSRFRNAVTTPRKHTLSVVGSEIAGDSQAEVHRLLCNESRLFASRPPSPVASLVASIIKERQTPSTADKEVQNSEDAENQNFEVSENQFEAEPESSKPKRHLEMFIPRVENDDPEDIEEAVAVREQIDHKNSEYFQGDPSPQAKMTSEVDQEEEEKLDYQYFDWEKQDPPIDPELFNLETLLSPLGMSPSLREVTNAYAQNMFPGSSKNSVAAAQNVERSKKILSFAPRTADNFRPGYSSIDKTKQMRPPRPGTRRLSFTQPDDGHASQLQQAKPDDKDTDGKPTNELRSASSLSIASLTFFEDLNPDFDPSNNAALSSQRSSISNIMKSRSKSAKQSASNKNGVLRKQAKLRGITGIDVRTSQNGNDENQASDFDNDSLYGNLTSEKKTLTTITFGSKNTVLENGYLIHTNENKERQSVNRPKTAVPIAHSPRNEELTGTPRVEKVILDYQNSATNYIGRQQFPNRNNAAYLLRSRVKSAPMIPSKRTVVKVQYGPDTDLGSLVLFSSKAEEPLSRASTPRQSSKNRQSIPQKTVSSGSSTPRPVFKPLTSVSGRAKGLQGRPMHNAFQTQHILGHAAK